MNKKYVKRNIALVGAGYWGKNLLRNLHALGALHTLCDRDVEKLDSFKKVYRGIRTETSLRKVLENRGIHAVAVATPAETHHVLAKEILNAGKDVFIEKPLSLTVKEGEELISLARKKRKIIMVGHILQYHPAAVKLKELVKSGKLGKIEYIYSNRLNIGKLRTEENILWSFAPHDISVILMLLDEEPVGIRSVGGDYLNDGIFDTTMTTLEFKNGVKGHIFVSWLHPFKEQKLVVVGSKGMAVFDDVSEEKLFFYSHKIKWKDGKFPVAEKAELKVVPFKKGEPLKLELEHFLECVQKRKTPKTDGKEGLRVLRILEGAERSLLRSDRPVHTSKDLPYLVHESSYIDDNVKIGKGTRIWHFSHVLDGSRIGKDCRIGQNVVIGPKVRVGNNVKIQNNVSVYEGITLEDDVFCGPSMVFTNVLNPRSEIPRMKEMRKTLVQKGASIGANATIICGNDIGKYSFIGAGAVITKNVSDYAIMTGNPARRSGWMCRCGMKLRKNGTKLSCEACGDRYKLAKGNVEVVEKRR